MRISSFTTLLAFGGLAYGLYRLLEAESAVLERRRTGGHSPDLRRALNENEGRMNETTAARGMAVDVEEPDGGHTRRVVGRGVIRTD
jgi:hypothetical protein